MEKTNKNLQSQLETLEKEQGCLENMNKDLKNEKSILESQNEEAYCQMEKSKK